MAALGCFGLALSCLAGVLRWFGANPSDLGFLNADSSLPVELFAWAFFTIALLFVLRSAAARGASIYVRAGAAVCLVGAMAECASVGFSVRSVTDFSPPISLFKAEFTFASLGWLLLAAGVFILQRNWASGRQLSTPRTARGAWQRALLVVTIALLSSAGGEALGFGSLVAWPHSTSEPALIASYAPEVLTWIAVAIAGLIVVNAARRGLFARQLLVPAGLAALGGAVLAASAAALFVAGQLVYHFFKFAWITPLLRIQTVGACAGMLVLAGACIAAAIRQDAGPTGRDLPAPPAYWPRVAAANS
jgi:hypothetical protein